LPPPSQLTIRNLPDPLTGLASRSGSRHPQWPTPALTAVKREPHGAARYRRHPRAVDAPRARGRPQRPRSRRPRWQRLPPDMGWSPPPSDQRWSMTSPLPTVASLTSAIAGPLSATAPAAATPRLSRSSCPGHWIGRPTMASRPTSAAWRWLDADVGVGADDAVDERPRVSASRYASVHMASNCPAAQRSSWMRIRLPAGSRKAQSRTPYGCSVGSWTTSASLACSRSKVPSRSLVARRIQP